MSINSKKVAAILVTATAGAGALAAAPAMAQHNHGSGSSHRQPVTQPAPTQPVNAPNPQTPVIGVVHPDPPGTTPAPPVRDRQQGPPVGNAQQDGPFDPVDQEFSPRAAGPGTWQWPGTRRGRSFHVACEFETSGVFDPILFPGQEPAGHEHQFFGAFTINPASTPASLVADNKDGDSTSCMARRDGSAYWVPALQVADDPAHPVTIEPDEISVRYSAPRNRRVRAFPAGFSMVAGDKAATTLQANAGWRCEFDRPGTPLEAAPPDCEPDEAVVGVVRFPGCWDGTNLTSLTQAHVAYRVGSRCPSTHPVALPDLTEEVFWVPDDGEHTYALSSGNPAGLHADFMNGWDQRTLRNQVRRYLNRRA